MIARRFDTQPRVSYDAEHGVSNVLNPHTPSDTEEFVEIPGLQGSGIARLVSLVITMSSVLLGGFSPVPGVPTAVGTDLHRGTWAAFSVAVRLTGTVFYGEFRRCGGWMGDL